MSKSNMLLGLAKGKVGDLVFYRDGGEQRTRTRVVPKNPRTYAQMAQRVKIANVSGIYRAAAQILRDSFSNRPSNQSGYNAFSAGAIINAPYITSSMAKAGVCIPQPAMMSRGVLPSLPYVTLASEGTYGIGIPVDFQALRPVSLGDISTGLLQQFPSLAVGDEINFVDIRFRPVEGVESEVDTYNVETKISTLVLDPSNNANPQVGGIVSSETNVHGSAAESNGEDGIVMSFIIHSRVDSDRKLQVSTQWAQLSDTAQTLYDNYRSEEALQDAIESYNANPATILR